MTIVQTQGSCNDYFKMGVSVNIIDFDQTPYVAFHLGLHYLPKNMYLFIGIQKENVNFILVLIQLSAKVPVYRYPE